MDIEIIYNEEDFIEFEKKLDQMVMLLRQNPELESQPHLLFEKLYGKQINDDRNNLCLNIYLDLDNQKEISYITNQKYISVNKKTKFNYSVFIL